MDRTEGGSEDYNGVDNAFCPLDRSGPRSAEPEPSEILTHGVVATPE